MGRSRPRDCPCTGFTRARRRLRTYKELTRLKRPPPFAVLMFFARAWSRPGEAMRGISDRARELVWSRPSLLRMEWVLLSGDEPVANLKFRSMLGTVATADNGDGSWTFKRVGFCRTRATIRTSLSEDELAVFQKDTWRSRGELIFASGRKFRVTTNFWLTELQLGTEAGLPLARINYGGCFHRTAKVRISDAARA